MSPVRTVEQSAPEVLAELVQKLVPLTTDQPTTVELEEAIKISRAVTRALFEWLAARYTAPAAASKAYSIPTVFANLSDLASPFIKRNSA